MGSSWPWVVDALHPRPTHTHTHIHTHTRALHAQELLDTPNAHSPAQSDAYVAFTQRLAEYRKKVQQQALKYTPPS